MRQEAKTGSGQLGNPRRPTVFFFLRAGVGGFPRKEQDYFLFHTVLFYFICFCFLFSLPFYTQATDFNFVSSSFRHSP